MLHLVLVVYRRSGGRHCRFLLSGLLAAPHLTPSLTTGKPMEGTITLEQELCLLLSCRAELIPVHFYKASVKIPSLAECCCDANEGCPLWVGAGTLRGEPLWSPRAGGCQCWEPTVPRSACSSGGMEKALWNLSLGWKCTSSPSSSRMCLCAVLSVVS